MKRNKLFIVFASLTKLELNHFKKYISYPLYNTQKPLITLVNFLGKELVGTTIEDYDGLREKAFKKMYPKKPYNGLKMRQMIAGVYALLSDFLVQEELKLEKELNATVLSKSLRRRRLSDLYLASLTQKQRNLEKTTTRDFYYFQNIVQLQHDLYYYPSANKYAEKNPLSALAKIHSDLDTGYVLTKLHHACQVIVIQRFRGQTREVLFLEEVLAMARKESFANNELVQLYLQFIALLQDTTEEGYNKVKKNFFELIPLMNKEVQFHLFVLLINLTWLAVEPSKIARVAFELYAEGLEMELVMDGGIMGASHFNNIVDIGCSLGEFERIRIFISKYLPYLDLGEDKLENVKNLFESFLCFGEGEFAKALLNLNYLEFGDFTYGFRAYLLTIKSLYETKKEKGYKEIETNSEAFKQYIKRKYKQGFISAPMREDNLNFIKIANQLPFASRSKFAKITHEDLKNKLLSMERVLSRNWLQEKIEAL